MFTNTLFVHALLSLLAAAIYLIVGFRVRSRSIKEKNAQKAWMLFSNYWIALAISAGAAALQNILGGAGILDVSLFVIISNISLLAASYAVFALAYYLLYIFTGNPKWRLPLAYLYSAFFLVTIYILAANNPVGIELGAWSTSIVYENPLEGPVLIALLVFLIVPTLLGSLAYLTLFFRVREASQKYRILLVSISIIVWFGTSLGASLSGASENDLWPLISRFIGIGAAAAIYFAYFPPSWAMAKWNVKAVS